MNSTAGNIFRISLYTAICLATIGLWMGEDNPPPYPLLVIFCVIAAYAFTDTWGILTIPHAMHIWLALGVIAFFVREEMASYKIDPVMPLGHLIALFQIILLFQIKTPRTYWLLLLTCFLQMLIAALHNSRVSFGILMGCFLILIVWTMTQFLLLREAERHTAAQQRPNRDFRRSAVGAIGSSLLIFTVAMLMFLIIPRRGQTAWTQTAHRPGQYLSGFNQSIRLGQLGTILESDEEVMTIRLFDERGQSIRPREEPYWRGVALSYYEAGRWERVVDVETVPLDWARRPDRYIRQEIRLQGIHGDVLFGIWPTFRGQTRSGEPLAKIGRDGSLVRPDGVPSGPLQYTLDSVAGVPVRLSDEIGPYSDERDYRLTQLTQVPANLTGYLQQYAVQNDLVTNTGHEEVCRRVLNHLTDPNQFDYTLRATVMDSAVDPIVDFLFNRKEGHCEYFASAMALLLRSQGVPARVVNGFKGGDWNDLFAPSMVVRQKHAHSWVEALLPSPDRAERIWVTLDPTPGPGRQRVAAAVSSSPSLVRQVRDISRQLWSNYVLNFNSSEQEAAVYGPFRKLVLENIKQRAEKLRSDWAKRGGRFNWIAAIAASVFTLLLFIVGRLFVRILVRGRLLTVEHAGPGMRGFLGRMMDQVGNLLARWVPGTSSGRTRIDFYDNLLRLLASHGLMKRPNWTAEQFAEFAEAELQGKLNAAAAAHIPAELVQRYYRVRFGNNPLDSTESDEIDRMLEVLGSTVNRQ